MELIDQTRFQILGITRAKLFLSGWISFLWSQVIQSVAVDVIVLVHSMRRERVHEGKEPGAEPCNGSSLLGPGMNLQHRGRRGEERKHTYA